MSRTSPETASVAWRYEIQHGPDGETDYAWVYAGDNLVCTTKTHYAITIVAAMGRGLAPTGQETTVDELGGWIEHGLAYGISSKDGRMCARNLLNQFEIRPKALSDTSTDRTSK